MRSSAQLSSEIHQKIRSVYELDAFWDLILNSAAEAGPFDGGCLVCAYAIQSAFGGDLVRLVNDAGRTQHYGVRIDDCYFDFDGAASTQELWAKRFADNELVSGPLSVLEGYESNQPTAVDPAVSHGISELLKAKEHY